MEDLEFRIGPKSFYQTNSPADPAYVPKDQGICGPGGDRDRLRRYTEHRTIALGLAHYRRRVTGVECV